MTLLSHIFTNNKALFSNKIELILVNSHQTIKIEQDLASHDDIGIRSKLPSKSPRKPPKLRVANFYQKLGISFSLSFSLPQILTQAKSNSNQTTKNIIEFQTPSKFSSHKALNPNSQLQLPNTA